MSENSTPLTEYGWNATLSNTFTDLAPPDSAPGRILRVDRGRCDVAVAEGTVRALSGSDPLCTGDWVAVAELRDSREPEMHTVTSILPRSSSIVRSSHPENRKARFWRPMSTPSSSPRLRTATSISGASSDYSHSPGKVVQPLSSHSPNRMQLTISPTLSPRSLPLRPAQQCWPSVPRPTKEWMYSMQFWTAPWRYSVHQAPVSRRSRTPSSRTPQTPIDSRPVAFGPVTERDATPPSPES